MAILVSLSTGCGSLLTATQAGDVAGVQKMLANGADPNKTVDNVAPLCAAIAQDQDAITEMLLKARANPNVTCSVDSTKLTALEYAASRRRVEVVKSLLAHDADPLAQGDPPMLFLVRMTTSGGTDSAGIGGIYLDHIERVYGRPKMLEVATSNVGWSPLSRAAYSGDNGMVRELLAHGIDPKSLMPASGLADTPDLWPAIYFAWLGHHEGTADVLLKAGADRKATTRNGETFEDAIEARQERLDKEEADEAAAVAMKRKQEREERREERRQAQASRAQWNTFQKSMAGGGGGSGSSGSGSGSAPARPARPANPVDDNSFQDRMKKLASPSPSAPAPAPAAESSPSERKAPAAAARPAGGGIVLTTNNEKAPPPAPAAAAPSTGRSTTTASTPATTSTRPPPSATPQCRETPAPRRKAFFQGVTREEVKAQILASAKAMCSDAGGDGKILSNDCSEMTLIGTKHIECKVEIECNAPLRQCGNPKIGATKQ